jgi:ferritin-like metal-binding protein YciE
MTDLEQQLVNYIEDAHAVEQHMLWALDRMIETTEDPKMRGHLQHHRAETERHKLRLEERLEAHGVTPSAVKDTGQIFLALGKGMIDKVRSDNAGKNLRDGFVAEHLEIACYELLERVAQIAGDEATAEVARGNRADEEAMVQKIRASWDEAVRQSLQQEGIQDRVLVAKRGAS